MERTTRRTMRWNVALSSLLFAACVTINVYFPAAAAEKAADQIIDKVTSGSVITGRGASMPAPMPESVPQPAPSALPAPPPPVQSPPVQSPPVQSPPKMAEQKLQHSLLAQVVADALERLVPAAYAQADANIDITSTEIRTITASMQARYEQLEKYFSSGAIGLTNDGLIDLRDAATVPLAERAVAKRLVAEDNRDRAALYAEIARANGHADWEADIRRIFARRWVERGAKTGWYYQNAAGAWVQK